MDTVRENLEGAKYTLAVNAAAKAMGINDFADIAAKSDALEGKIFGIEPGNDGNRLIQSMIDENAFDLKDFEVVESSEQGLLAQAQPGTPNEHPGGGPRRRVRRMARGRRVRGRGQGRDELGRAGGDGDVRAPADEERERRETKAAAHEEHARQHPDQPGEAQ